MGRAQAARRRAPSGSALPELSEGTTARSNRCSRPLAKSGLGLDLRVRSLTVSPAGEPEEETRPPGGSWSPAYRQGLPCRRPSIPAWFSVNLRPRASGSGALALSGQSSRPKTPESLDQRAGPTRLKFPVSRDFRAAVSLGPLTFPRNRLLGKHSNFACCA